VTDFLNDSPHLARFYCPRCQPELDPSREILETRWCGEHHDAGRGVEDDAVACGYVTSSTEAGGEDNRAWCELFHRKKRLLRSS